MRGKKRKAKWKVEKREGYSRREVECALTCKNSIEKQKGKGK